MHHYEGSRVEISAHRISSLGQVLSRVVISGDGTAFGGDLGVWEHLPRAYVAWYEKGEVKDYFLFLLDYQTRAVEMQQFDWFDNRMVQRSSTLILFDPREGVW